MRKFTLISFAVLALAASAVLTSVASGSTSNGPLIVAMKDRVVTGSTSAVDRINVGTRSHSRGSDR